MEEQIERTKVCPIFEPTFRSIMCLQDEHTKLKLFESLCNYAFDEIEPEFETTPEGNMLNALWMQFKVVFIQSKKRARINSANGKKGGRPPKKANENIEQQEIKCDENIQDDEIF